MYKTALKYTYISSTFVAIQSSYDRSPEVRISYTINDHIDSTVNILIICAQQYMCRYPSEKSEHNKTDNSSTIVI